MLVKINKCEIRVQEAVMPGPEARLRFLSPQCVVVRSY